MDRLGAITLALSSAVWLAVACTDRPPSTDAGPDPDISDCCLYFLLPVYYDEPEVCLRKHTEPGECRWLTCLGGLATYNVCVPEDL